MFRIRIKLSNSVSKMLYCFWFFLRLFFFHYFIVIINNPWYFGLGPEPKPKLRGDVRTFRVWLDPNQYQQDMTSSIQSNTEDPYETFNIIMRRKPKENNFKVWIALASDLEFCFCQHRPELCITVFSVLALRLGPGWLWGCHTMSPFQWSL